MLKECCGVGLFVLVLSNINIVWQVMLATPFNI